MAETKYVNLNKVYTKRGDKGKTDLFGGSQASKASLKVNAYGAIDELGAFLGLVRFYSKEEDIKSLMLELEKKLLIVGGFLASDEKGQAMMKVKIEEEDIRFLEEKIDFYNAKLPDLFAFILPGDTEVSSYLHVARTVARRAERAMVALAETEMLQENLLKYINRSSDLLFILARYDAEILQK